MITRPATADDAEAVARIYYQSGNAGYNENGQRYPLRTVTAEAIDFWRGELASVRAWVAEVAGEVVGFCAICEGRFVTGAGEIDSIHVDPSHWRTGAGRALMQVALDELRRDGYDEVILWTLDEYPRSHAFYAATDWRLDASVVRVSFPHRLGSDNQFVLFRQFL